jgi:hypothetical protein
MEPTLYVMRKCTVPSSLLEKVKFLTKDFAVSLVVYLHEDCKQEVSFQSTFNLDSQYSMPFLGDYKGVVNLSTGVQQLDDWRH